MTTERIDVLAAVDRLIDVATVAALPVLARDGQAARAAVAELIEADKEYDAACAVLKEQEHADDDDELYLSALRRHQWARDRRAAALARVGAP